MAVAHIITKGLSTGSNGHLLVSWGLGTGGAVVGDNVLFSVVAAQTYLAGADVAGYYLAGATEHQFNVNYVVEQQTLN